MLHPYETLAPEYEALWARMVVKPNAAKQVDQTAKRLLRDLSVYKPVYLATKVPVAVIMCISEHEMSGRTDRNLAQGDPLTDYSVHVPAGEPRVGHGPPFTFEEAAIRALEIDGLDDVPAWSVPRALYEFEIYNGTGYRNKGLRSPYLWGGTNNQQPGKYTSDGHFDPSAMDTQLGTAPLMRRIMELDSSLVIPGADLGSPIVTPTPVGIGGSVGSHDTYWLQRALMAMGFNPNGIDGVYGRDTRAAVRAYQTANGLTVDGIAGPQTYGSLEKDLEARGLTRPDGP